jgi:hypothetical protein
VSTFLAILPWSLLFFALRSDYKLWCRVQELEKERDELQDAFDYTATALMKSRSDCADLLKTKRAVMNHVDRMPTNTNYLKLGL